MEPDRLTPQLRRIVDAAESLDERLLVLLSVRKAEPAPILAEMLGLERGGTMAALGRLSQRGLVSHQRPEGEPIHWFATQNGKLQGEQLHRAIVARQLAESESAQPDAVAPEATPADAGEQKPVKARRRVSIDQNEKTGFSWD